MEQTVALLGYGRCTGVSTRVQCPAFDDKRGRRETLEEEEEFLVDGDDDDDEDEEEEARPEKATDENGGEASLDEILTKKPEERPAPDEEEEEESILSLGREERTETLSVKVVPPDPDKEFTCRKCYLVKHRSQLADKKRMYCRDCV
jgi:hypothetical protein